ncbi:MAG TPA: capsule assembly Wzi family protein [Acidobacteriaceae bacterium]|nr:capsule assembly Wzi family protein [Acidobacteriaceae bacterium]
MEFPAVLCVLAVMTTGISAASTTAVPASISQQDTQSSPQQTPPASTGVAPPAADQLPPPRENIRFAPYEPLKSIEGMSSTYIPLDSWIYPAVMRLYSMGFVDTVFLGMRPWTRLSVAHMMEASSDRITSSNNDEAIEIFAAIERDLQPDMRIPLDQRFGRAGLDSVYQRVLGIGGTPLRDSFHLGQTDINDFGRPYASGFNSYSGLSARASYGMFSIYLRAEFQHAPSWEGYPLNLAETLAAIDDFDTFSMVPLPGNATIPLGPVSSVNNLTVLEGYVSAHILGNEVSFGKMDNWYGPGIGGGMAWSNNAENVWSFRINRVEPLYIPYISRIAGLIRYDFFVGPLKGHNDPVSPWVHAEKIAFKPTPNFEFGFQRTVIWGGKGHEPVTLGTFWRSFYSISDTNGDEKFSPRDPGARFSSVDFSYRLPYLRKWLTLYTDSEVHDDVFPITAPRHAAVRPGLYLSHFPGAPKLDLRVEGVSTDPDTGLSNGGADMYIEVVQRNGYTSNGLLMGDWIGREGKGGQAWLTYHLSPREWLQLNYRTAKASKDFIPGGTTQNDLSFDVTKRLTPDVELKANVQYERWLIPIYKVGRRSDTGVTFQITWYPRLDRRF